MASQQEQPRTLCGGIRPADDLDAPEHHEYVKAALAKTVGCDPDHSERSYKIVSAKRQTVAGTKYTLVITFDDDVAQQQFSVVAWSRPWLTDPEEALKITFGKKE
ncbi:uncharacterized protein LOC129742587 isoform X2 [Uranotaenia lowii]|nr:uncharacterized protein LOC129742587 isoform X2 [Uranotaenia lowii]